MKSTRRIKTAGLIFLIFMFFLLGAGPSQAVQLPTGSEIHYSIKSDGVLIGYSIYKVERNMQLAGESFIKFQSLSVLKTGMGYIDESVFQTDFSVDSETLVPSYLLLQQSDSTQQLFSETLFSQGLIAQKNVAGNTSESSVHNTENGCLLFMTNLWGKLDTMVEHYLLLVLKATEEKIDKIPVYDPVLRAEGTVGIVKGPNDTIKVLGRNTPCATFVLSDFYDIPLMKIWYDWKNKKIVRMEEIGGTIVFELSTQAVSKELDKSPGQDMWSYRTFVSPIYFPDNLDVKTFAITGRFTGRGFVTPDRKVLGFEQTFKGDMDPNSLNGSFLVKAEPVTVDQPNRFPPFKLGEEYAAYLKPQPGIESDNDYIVNKAQEITWKSLDSLSAAVKISKWLKENIKTGTSMPSALFAFNAGVANSESRAFLMTAMCRAVGLPARTVGGMVFDKGDFVTGYWVEVYIENNGWVPFEPGKEKEGVSAVRVFLWEFGDLTSAAVDTIDFAPKPPARVSFQQKDLAWPIGEERVYQIKREEQIIGEERAVMEDLLINEEGQEIYRLRTTSTLNLGGQTFTSNAVVDMDIYGLALAFRSDSVIGSSTTKHNFKFENNFISYITEGPDDTELIRKIPYSRGTYLLDQRYLSLWALVMGQIPRLEINKTYDFTAFIPEEMQVRNIELEVKGYERVEAEGTELNTFKCETKNGIVFYIEPGGRVVKIDLNAQDLEFVLVETDLNFGGSSKDEDGKEAQDESSGGAEPSGGGASARPAEETQQKETQRTEPDEKSSDGGSSVRENAEDGKAESTEEKK